MRAGRAVLDALRHRVRFVPDDVAAQVPSVLLEAQSEAPGNPEEVLGLEAFGRVGADIHGSRSVLLVRGAPPPVPARIAVPDIEPERAVILQHAPDLRKDRHQAVQVLRERLLQADLAGRIVVPKPPVRRRGDDRLNTPIREARQDHVSVTFDDAGGVDPQSMRRIDLGLFQLYRPAARVSPVESAHSSS